MNNRLIFQSVHPSANKLKTSVYGDKTWIHPSGDIAVLIDGVSGCVDDSDAADSCIEHLEIQAKARLQHHLDDVLQELGRLLYKKNLQAVIGIIIYLDKEAELYCVGNVNLLEITENTLISHMGDSEGQPTQVLGQQGAISPIRKTITINSNATYILCSDGIEAAKVRQNISKIKEARSYRDWIDIGNSSCLDGDWSLIVFPIESRICYDKQDWPYNPFVGPQEDYEHEKAGLADIASELFRHPEFLGFKIVGGVHFSKKNTTRRLDGILVSPWGVVLLELKDHDQKISLPLSSNQKMQVSSRNAEPRYEGNPVFKVIDVQPTFGEFSLGADIPVTLRKIGAVVFTNPKAEVTCIDAQGAPHALPYKSGDVLIVRPSDLAHELKSYAVSVVGKKNRRPLDAFIDTITSSLRDPGNIEAKSNDHISLGEYLIDPVKIVTESSQYYDVYRAYKPSIDMHVWVKKYHLSALTRGEPELEAQRIGREVAALEKLKLRDISGIQKSIGSIRDGNTLYVVVSIPASTTLTGWLQTLPDRQTKINFLINIIETLSDLHDNGIIHRALSPENIRVDNKSRSQLINFEMCKMDHLATLPITGRRELDIQYVAREANMPGAQITPAADIYSFGKIVMYVLAGKIPFNSYNEQPMAQRKKDFWLDVARDCGLPESEAQNLFRLVNINPNQRPTPSATLEILKRWQ